MLVIGLTGGIASGKTTISQHFSALGITVIDTDIISRALLEADQVGFHRVVEKFGTSVLLDDGSLNRRKLRQQVFNDDQLKQWLEAMLHPLIFDIAEQQIKACDHLPYVILVVPLLFESGFESLVDRVLVVDCARQCQLNRLIARDNINLSLAEKILAQQMSAQARLSRADDIIRNHNGLDLAPEIMALHQQYLAIANSWYHVR